MHESFKNAYYYLLEFNPDIAIPNCEELLELSEKEYGKYDYQVIELYFYIEICISKSKIFLNL